MDKLKDEDKKNPNYKTWLYNKIDGEIKAVVVDMDEAQKLYDQGWRLTPADFSEEYGQDPTFKSMASDVAGKMNILLNIDKITDKEAIIELGKLYGLTLKKTQTLKSLVYQVKQAAEKE